MGPHPSLLLVFVLCLGQAVHTQDGVLPKPSIRARPGRVIPRGQPVTIVCRGPAGADTFRLQDKNRNSVYWDQKNVSQHDLHWAEATFHISTVTEFTPGSYFCRYLKRSDWSEPSETLELKVTDGDVSTPPSGAPRVISSTPTTPTKPPSTTGLRYSISIPTESPTSRAAPEGTELTQTNSQDAKTSSLSPEHLYIFVSICVTFLLCLLLLALLLFHRQCQKKRGPPSSKDEEPRPQERLSSTVDITESPADVATTVDALPEENGDVHSPGPATGDPQEVTYAQLDLRALTRRAARTEFPQPTEPTAESSTCAALPRP